MTWNNVYLSTPNPVGNYQGSAASTVLSDLSISGSLDVATVDAATANATSLVSTAAIQVGGTAESLTALSTQTNTNTLTPIAGSHNTTEAFAWTGSTLTDSDTIIVGAPSALSNTIVYDAYVDSNASVVLRMSNVSTLDVTQTAQTWRFTVLDFGDAI